MASSTASPASSAPPAGRSPSFSARQWLILGVCFGVGYGIADRLVNLQLTPTWSTEQRFEVRSFPGTELQTLRRQSGDSAISIRADLDRIETERQQKREAAELEKRRASLEGPGLPGPATGEPPEATPLPEAGGNAEPPALPAAPSLPPTAAPPAAPAEVPAAAPTRPPAVAAPTP